MNIHLEKIDYKNIWDVIDLKVKKSQKEFVAPNVVSIAQAYSVIDTECKAFPFAIYNGKKLVGFMMIVYNEALVYERFDGVDAPSALKNNYSICRLMIDKRYQNKGYGKEAIKLGLEFIKTWPCGKAEYCEISCGPDNTLAKELYESMGFKENGEMDGHELVLVLKL